MTDPRHPDKPNDGTHGTGERPQNSSSQQPPRVGQQGRANPGKPAGQAQQEKPEQPSKPNQPAGPGRPAGQEHPTGAAGPDQPAGQQRPAGAAAPAGRQPGGQAGGFGNQPPGPAGHPQQGQQPGNPALPHAPGPNPRAHHPSSQAPHARQQVGSQVPPRATQHPPHAGQQQGNRPLQPTPQPGGRPPFGPQGPPPVPPRPAQPPRRGPGWGALIATGVIAALIGGGTAVGVTAATGGIGGSRDGHSEIETSTSDQEVKTVDSPDWTAVAADASKSVVSIQARGAEGEALGSGFVYKDDHIVTNNHVVAPGDSAQSQISVVFSNGSSVAAKIVGRDPITDIAVLKLSTKPEGLSPLPIGDSSGLTVGEPVMALGNPLGLADTVTTGIVSALNRPVATQQKGSGGEADISTITNAIQVDAAINPGNSGGPLINAAGKFVGVNSSIATMPTSEGEQAGSIGIGFAIPATQAVYIADQLISSGKAKHAYLGVNITSGSVENDGITMGAAVVSKVEDGSPAAAAGVRKDDAIVKAGGTTVNSAISLQALVRAQKDGQELPLTIIRDGKTKEVTVSLKAR